jgi:hypothetical protein
MLTSAVLTILTLFSVHVLADVTWPDCTVSSLNWVRLNHFVSQLFTDRLSKTYNSLGQNPCEVAAFLQSICYGGGQSSFSRIASLAISSPRTEFHIPALPQGRAYNGPAYGDSTLCKCSTIVYSLLSACDACQGDPWFKYVLNPPFAFWAYLFLVGKIFRVIAQLDSLPHRESKFGVKIFLALTEMVSQFPCSRSCWNSRAPMGAY